MRKQLNPQYKKRSGLEDDPFYINQKCNSPSHNPPTHISIPQGKIYRHVCPKCGEEVILRSSPISLNNG